MQHMTQAAETATWQQFPMNARNYQQLLPVAKG
jgi:hypothetical protein